MNDLNHVCSQDDSFWCRSDIDKSDETDLVSRLQARASTSIPMLRFSLKRCQLRGINLVRGDNKGYECRQSDLYRADLREAHLFGLDLTGSSLMKADLRNANLHRVNLTDCDLLGVRLDGAKLEHVEWGCALMQEKEAHALLSKGKPAEALDLIEQAEEIYRNLRLNLERDGLFECAGRFFHKEMVMRRLQMPLWSNQRFVSKLADLFCGYGEKPLRVILFSMVMIVICAMLYMSIGIEQNGEYIGWQMTQTLAGNVNHFLTCVYFSVVTFTTLGYGDITPVGFVRPVAAFEAFVGSFTMALFVVVFVKKMTR